MNRPTILLNPGPVVLSERVRQALLQPDLCHREIEFIELQNKIRAALLAVYQLPIDEWAAILMSGSGTAAMEAMLGSLVPATGKIIILENGVYGQRLMQIAERQGIQYQVVQHAWDSCIQLDRLEKQLKEDRQITHIAVVQHETSTGQLNELDKIAALGRHFNVPLLVDGVSSFAAEEIRFQEWGIAACAATANKCIHAVPGVAFVIVNRQAMQRQTAPPRSLYLDLHNYLALQDAGSTPFTPAVHGLYALAAALAELAEIGGWRVRNTIYWQKMERVRNGLHRLGIAAYLDRARCCSVLNAFYLPKGIDYRQLHDRLKKEGFIIYASQGPLQDILFRISCMGEITMPDIERLLHAAAGIVGDRVG